MSFNSSVFAAGPYAVTFNSSSLGLFVGDLQAPTVEVQTKTQPIDNSDKYGRTTLGALHQGADAFFQGTFMEWNTAQKAALWPFGVLGVVGTHGGDLYDLAQALVLTAQAGTPAATSGPATLTASKACLAPNFNTRFLFSSVLREVPIRLQLFPYLNVSTPVHFTTT